MAELQPPGSGLSRSGSQRSAGSVRSTASSATITPSTPPQHSHHLSTPVNSDRHSSRSRSSRGRPRPQQAIYVPAGTPQGLPRVVAERAILGTSYPDSPSQWDEGLDLSMDEDAEGDGNGDYTYGGVDHADRNRDRAVRFDASTASGEDNAETTRAPRTASADDWDNVRDGSISRRPSWRRPSPRWLLPFLIGLTISVGMTMAPRAELYLDLACLAHPPQSTGEIAPAWQGSFDGTHTYSQPSIGVPGRVLSPGEKWFLDAQRDIFGTPGGTPRGDTGDDDKGTPDGPVPLPNGTVPGGGTSRPGGSIPFPEIDPSMCKTDKGVAAAAAKLTMTLTICVGLLAAMTTGHWAGVSDRIGRTTIMSIVEIGYLLNDACFLLIVSYPRIIMHGGIYVLLVGPTLEGLLGGISTYSATVHAYISDVTPDGSRVTAFTRIAAFLMMGFSLGPILGSAVISASGNILFPFYVTVTIHLISSILIRFLLPESLSSESRAVLAKHAAASAQRKREREEAEIEAERAGTLDAGESGWSIVSVTTTPRRRAVGATRRLGRRSIVFLRPLTVFKPRKRDDGVMDYNLALLGTGTFLLSLIMGVLQLKPNYVFFAFSWGWAELGPYMSFVGFCRFIVLVGIMPICVYFVKPFFTERAIIEHQSNDPDASPWRTTRDASPRNERTATENTPLLSTPGASSSRKPVAGRSRSRSSSCSSRSPSPGPDDKPKPKRTAALDLLVIRASVVIEAASFVLMGLNTVRNQHVFIVASALITLGSASGSAVNSLALSFLPHQREAGRLFGGIAVLQAIGSNLMAPLLFSNVFAWAVRSPTGWVEVIFLLAGGIMMAAFVVFGLVRIPRNNGNDEERGRSINKGRRARARD